MRHSFMNVLIKIIICLAGLLLTSSVHSQGSVLVINKEKTGLSFSLNKNGTPQYTVSFNQQEVIRTSSLGFSLESDSSFNKNFTLITSKKRSVDESWQPVWGEVGSIRNQYEELIVQLQHKSGKLLNIIFRVFADGVGFRYEFPKQPGLKYFIVTDEFTEFNMTGDHKTFWIPGDYDTNEYSYTTSKLSEIDNRPVVASATDIAVRTVPDAYAVQTPLMMKIRDGLYINIHEAALVNYPAMQLACGQKYI